MFEKIRESKDVQRTVRKIFKFGRTLDNPWGDAPGAIPYVGRVIMTGAGLWSTYVSKESSKYHWAEFISDRKCEQSFRSFLQLFMDTKNDLVQKAETVWVSDDEQERVDKWYLTDDHYVLAPYELHHMQGWVFQRTLYCEPGQVSAVQEAWADKFWDTYGGLITFETVRTQSGMSVNPVELQLSPDRKYVGPHDVESIDTYIKAFEENGFNRSFLFQGPPGTGKTTISYQLAQRRSGRALHLSIPLIMGYFGVERINDVIELLRPSVLLLDDIHLMGFGNKSDLLHMLEWINEHPSLGTLLIATSNEISSINQAMRRPGRFDEILIFGYPTKEERIEVLDVYSKLYKCDDLFEEMGQEFVDKLIFHTAGLTHAFIKDLCKSLASLRKLPKENFLNALESRLFGMHVASDRYAWHITDVKIDLRAPLPTDKSLAEELREAEKAVRKIQRKIEDAQKAGIESGEEDDKSSDDDSVEVAEPESDAESDDKGILDRAKEMIGLGSDDEEEPANGVSDSGSA